MECNVKKQIQGFQTQDGAGVRLVRVLGGKTVGDFDPFLMLDSFDSVHPEEYTAGFPMHPHRGIETISYVYQGKMMHRDSLGHEDEISDGEVQWMTAGSGIMHEERIPAAGRLLGVQLWLNLPQKDKMADPFYHAVKKDEICEIALDGGTLRLLAGTFADRQGYMGRYLPLNYYDIHLEAGAAVTVPVEASHFAMVFTLSGDVFAGGVPVKEKTAAGLTKGDRVTLMSRGQAAQVLLISSRPLGEAVSWGGPIVMNTGEELKHAFKELNNGTFLKKAVSYSQGDN